MKTLITFLFVLIASVVHSQTVSFDYDEAGNRKSGNIITLRSAQPQTVDEPERYSEQLSTFKVTIYPNPTKGHLRIVLSDIEKSPIVNLYSINGQLLYKSTVNNQVHEMDITKQPKGIYIIKIINGKDISTWKIIKE